MALSFPEVVRDVRQRVRLETPDPPLPTAECLDFSELRRFALRPEDAAPVTLEHLRSCLRCSRAAASCARELPHLPWWVLFGAELGRLSPEEERAVQYHLREGGCSLCTARLRQFASRGSAWLDPLFPPFGHAAQESRKPPVLGAYFPGGYYEVELLQAAPRFECEIRTRSVALRTHLFAFTSYGNRPHGDPLVGYAVLGEEGKGWYRGRISAENPGAPSDAGFSGTYILALRPDELREEEVDQLLSVVGPTLGEPAVRERWANWLSGVTPMVGKEGASPAQRLVRELQVRLAP